MKLFRLAHGSTWLYEFEEAAIAIAIAVAEQNLPMEYIYREVVSFLKAGHTVGTRDRRWLYVLSDNTFSGSDFSEVSEAEFCKYLEKYFKGGDTNERLDGQVNRTVKRRKCRS
jgi:hypothetical protein